MEMGFYFCCVCCFLVFFSKASTATDIISPSESLTDAMTLVSNGGAFVLGFFSPGASKNRYLGIWFKDIPVQTVVWVANRISPINDSTGVLRIESSGRVVLQAQNRTAVWSANTTASAQNPVLQLLDSGNLVVRDGSDTNPENYLWQSFDYPTDTMLPGMKIGVDLRTGIDRKLSAWNNWDDPSPGDLTYGVDLEGSPEMVLWKGSETYSESGLWVGAGFSGAPTYASNPIFEYDFVWNENEIYYIYSLRNQSVQMKNVLNQTQSQSQFYTWNPESQTWQLFLALPIDYCDRYGRCGPNANCDSNKLPSCQCLPGFKPKWPQRWSSSDYSGGCVLSKPLNCQQGDGFIRIANVKTPDTTTSWANKTMDIKECRDRCLKNCSCMGYSNLYITGGGSGCVMWFGDLLTIKQLQTQGQDLNIRVSASQAEQKKTPKVKLAIILSTVIGASLVLLLVVCYVRRRRRKLTDEVEDNNVNDKEDKDENEDMELAVFEFGTIAIATDNFSLHNKLGEGGFGPVYKVKATVF
ncbi:hypothetical protein V6N13_049688 [Hibiscus sabdariffa]